MKIIGATYGSATPHSAEAIITSQDVGLFDFLMADKTLCQVSDLKVTSNLDKEDGKKIASGRKRTVVQDVLADLTVIGQVKGGKIQRVNHPIPPGSKVSKATKKTIRN